MVHVTLLPGKRKPSIIDRPEIGRLMKISKDGDQILIANPEVKAMDEFTTKNSNFRWGYWIDVDAVTLAEYPEDV